MRNDEAKHLFERARAFAKRRGYPQDADDFAQEVFIAIAGGRKATLEQLLIDFLRNQHGHTRSPGGRARAAERRFGRSLDQPVGEGEDGALLHESIGCPRGYSESIGHHWDSLRGSERAMLILFYVWGFHETEIADCFGVTGARVSQRLTRAKERLSKRIAAAQSGAPRQAARLQQGLRGNEGQEVAAGKDQALAQKESRGLEGAYATGFDQWLT